MKHRQTDTPAISQIFSRAESLGLDLDDLSDRALVSSFMAELMELGKGRQPHLSFCVRRRFKKLGIVDRGGLTEKGKRLLKELEDR